MGGFPEPLQKFAAACENSDFVIIVNFYTVKNFLIFFGAYYLGLMLEQPLVMLNICSALFKHETRNTKISLYHLPKIFRPVLGIKGC